MHKSKEQSAVWLRDYSFLNAVASASEMAPKVSGKAAKKASKVKSTKPGEKKKRHHRKESYSIYIYKVLKQVSECGMARGGIERAMDDG